MVTWQYIKLNTLQKMFAADGNTIPTDTSTRDYIAAMPGAANEALQHLVTAGKFIIKSIDIAHNPVRNLISDGAHIHASERGTMEFSAEGTRSIFFEYFGAINYAIFVDGVKTYEESLAEETGYKSIRRLVANPDDKKVVLEISSQYPFAVKNVALYSADYPTEDKIPTFAEKVRYPLKELAPDYYMLDTEDIYYEGDADISRYVRTSDYFQEGNTVLVLDRDTPGNFKIYYKAYPPKITSDTADNTELELDDEVVPLMILYMAAELYKDDDNGIATSYRNEFEVGFERLRNKANTPSAEKFTSESGWI